MKKLAGKMAIMSHHIRVRGSEDQNIYIDTSVMQQDRLNTVPPFHKDVFFVFESGLFN